MKDYHNQLIWTKEEFTWLVDVGQWNALVIISALIILVSILTVHMNILFCWGKIFGLGEIYNLLFLQFNSNLLFWNESNIGSTHREHRWKSCIPQYENCISCSHTCDILSIKTMTDLCKMCTQKVKQDHSVNWFDSRYFRLVRWLIGCKYKRLPL